MAFHSTSDAVQLVSHRQALLRVYPFAEIANRGAAARDHILHCRVRLNPIIESSVASITKSCAEAGFTSYSIKIVVDEGQGAIGGTETILVPKDFICKSKYKARALHYALRHLPNSDKAWILHLDEDARVTTHCVKSVVRYAQAGSNPVANGPSIFPYDGNLFTFYAEAQRQWTFYWLQDQEESSTVHWLNGSNLLIRSDIEQAVGWDFINCFISEDARFGYEATEKLGHVFGWHGGLTVETPPASVRGLVKQRTRWFYGSILNLRYVPKRRLPRRVYSIAAWLDGFVLSSFLVLFIFGVNRGGWVSHAFTMYGLTATVVLWLSRYQIGVYQNLRFSVVPSWKKVLLHIGIIPLAPITDILCNIPTVLALIRRPKAFEITSKKA